MHSFLDLHLGGCGYRGCWVVGTAVVKCTPPKKPFSEAPAWLLVRCITTTLLCLWSSPAHDPSVLLLVQVHQRAAAADSHRGGLIRQLRQLQLLLCV